jgi:hypothetical protein
MARTSLQWADVETRPAESGGDETTMTFSTLVFDAVTTQTRDQTADLPEHPVEARAAATDHVVPHPGRVSFEAHISSAVFDETILGSRRAQDLGETEARVVGADSPADRATDALAVLRDLVRYGTEVDILGLPFGDLEAYQLLSVSASQDQGTGSKLVPVIEARERITASVSEVEAPAPSVERTRPRREQGDQPANEDGSTDTHARAESRWHALARAAGAGSVGGI